MAVLPAAGRAQQAVPLTLTVEDSSGAAIHGATVKESSGQLLGRTDTSGRLTVQCSTPCRLRLDAEGFQGKDVEVSADTTVLLAPASGSEAVTVTA